MNQDSAAFIRAIKGPVMMITVGCLFALDNFTSLTFGRTWPVLMVVAGLLSLGRSGSRMDRLRGNFQYRAQWGPPRPPNPVPPVAPPAPKPSETSTAAPGTYRGSTYEATPGAPPRGTETRRPDTASSVGDPGATQ